MTTITVIVPTFNCAGYIGEAIRSILDQSRQPDEIVIVDDGSTDGTQDIVRSFHDSRLHYVYQANSGVSAARNLGIRKAAGEFIAFLDADDRWRPTMLQQQAAVLESDPGIVCCFTNFVRFEQVTGQFLSDQFRYYALDDLETRPGPIAESRLIVGDAFSGLVQFGIIPAYTQVMMFRSAAIRDVPFDEDLRLGEDTLFALRVFMKGGVAFNHEVLAEVRRHDTNTTADYRGVAVHEAVALRRLENFVHGGARARFYQERLVKAHIDAACVLIEQGHFRKGLASYASALGVPGAYQRKARGAARLALTLAHKGMSAGPFAGRG